MRGKKAPTPPDAALQARLLADLQARQPGLLHHRQDRLRRLLGMANRPIQQQIPQRKEKVR
ncbi:hypothetical protein CCR96_09050 [Halochromatium roseum]|nr:hypothetical protein [Halochromatium roseum]